MKDDNKRILAFLIWFNKSLLKNHMQFALGTYIIIAILFSPIPIEVFGIHNPILYAVFGLFLIMGIAYLIWYSILKKTMEKKISNAYLFIGTVFGSAALVSFASSAMIIFTSSISFGTAHIIANVAGIVLNLFVLIIRIAQYKSGREHEVRPAYGTGLMPLVLLGTYFLNSITGEHISRVFMASLVTTLTGYLITSFSVIFLINLFVARKHKMDEYYIASHSPASKRKK